MSTKAGESTPLLPKDLSSTHEEETTGRERNGDHSSITLEEKGIAYTQLFALCCAAITEPVACFCIFPFISEMIERTGGLRETDVGFWAGAIESLFSIVQMALMIFYGRMSDRYGRKPILVFSLFGLSISTALFGLSRSLWQMIIFRCLAGSFAGSVLTVRIMLAESCTKRSEAKAFAWSMFSRNFGILLGPIIGGAFANRELSGSNAVVGSHPYFLATLVTGIFCLCGTALVVVFAKETLVESKGTSETTKEAMSVRQLLAQPGVSISLFAFGYTMFLALANTAVLPVFLFTSVEKGGIGFSPQFISYFLAGLASCQALWTLICFPYLKQRLGTITVIRFCTAGWPLLFVCFPLLNEILRRQFTAAFWASMALPLLIGGGVAMSFACAQLLVNDACPSPSELALINALTQTVNSAVRAATPALFTSVFAIGTKNGWIDGHLCWIVLAIVALPLNWTLLRLPRSAKGLDRPGDG